MRDQQMKVQPMKPDLEKARRENCRWLILLALNAARPIGTSELVVLTSIQGVLPDISNLELRCELDYLENRELVELSHRDAGAWFCKLTRHGVDLVEYSVPCDAGIARPNKYW